MINEILEVQNYLNGKDINKKCLYRICYMLAKWFKQQGLSYIEIRQSIFEWGKKNDIYITCNLNSIIYKALSDKQRLREKIEVRISETDINEIKKRFDSKNCRKLALALLCVAKVSADSENIFSVSVTSLANWIGVDPGNCSTRYISELIDFDYIEKSNLPKVTYSWNGKVKSKSLTLKIKVPLFNNGNYILEDNNIKKLYSEIFEK